MRLQFTRNDIPESTRHKCVSLLNETLASGIDLALQAKQAHWNVKGPDFLQLHELFDKLRDGADEWVDMLAERAVQLGGVAEGTTGVVAERTKLAKYPLDIFRGADHLSAIARSLATFAKTVRDGIDTADEAHDAATADVFTEISRGADEMLWMVEAHLTQER